MQLVVSTLALMAFAANPTLAASETSPRSGYAGLEIAQASRVEQICVDAVSSSGYRVENILSTNTFSGGAEVMMSVRGRGESYVVGCDYSDNTGRIELYQLESNGYGHNNNRYEEQYSDRYENRSEGWYENQYDGQDNSRYDDQYNDRYENCNRYGDCYEEGSNRRYEDRYEEGFSDRHGNWQGEYTSSSGVRDEGEAEYIARGVVGNQLGIRDPYSDIVEIDDVHRASGQRNWIVEGKANGAPFVVEIRSSDAYILDFELY